MLNPDEQSERAYLDALLAKGHLIATGVPGVFGRGYDFERVAQAVDSAVTRLGEDDRADVWRFPPIIPRKTLERSEYMKSFPTLAGSVHSFVGGERDQMKLLNAIEGGHPWAEGLPPT